ncbi:hypothetical protein [Priestia taiwanensis]|uniref:Bleomycin resistance protein n=1 Tax=Priestia taiwanensis TaxID=1347902 RepID=A0A917AUB7_9BACI|nr:hypothetical protein [Priestia taiwanensis]MBM7364028.1 hypothetical protein [Priestia taiwanensis]GGE71088.1 hypothetical protein GCM10007140_21180 [Priestia taiwanensis]
MNTNELQELTRNRIIPIFNCMFEIDDTLEFYTALGFKITYYQKAPYRFASVKHDIAEISFYGDKNYDAENKAGGCYIVVPNIGEVYNELKTNLKSYYGKIPTRGLPRFSRVNQTAEDRRINVTDPSGNTLIIGQPLGDSTSMMQAEEESLKGVSTFEKKYKQAYRFAYSKEDFRAAKNVLEYAFIKHSDGISNELRYKASVLELDVLYTLGQLKKATSKLADIETIELTEEEMKILTDEIDRFIALKQELI